VALATALAPFEKLELEELENVVPPLAELELELELELKLKLCAIASLPPHLKNKLRRISTASACETKGWRTKLLTKDAARESGSRLTWRSCRNCCVEADTRANFDVRCRKCYKITKIAVLY